MTTAIAVYTSDGIVGRCDARCHDATQPECDCICGGRLHGCGADHAIEQNTRDLLGDDLADALREWGDARGYIDGELELRIPDPPAQLALLP